LRKAQGRVMTSPHEPPDHPLTMRANSAEDLLAVAPVALGFWPEESVVLLTFEAAHQFHARVDLPTTIRDAARPAEALLPAVLQHRPRRVVVLCYGDDRVLIEHVWHHLCSGLVEAGVDAVAALGIEDDRYYLIGDDEPGVPFDVTNHPFVVQAILAGRVIAPRRSEISVGLAADADACARVAALADDVAEIRRGSPEFPAEAQWVHDLVARHAASHEPFADVDLARLAVGIGSVHLRDAAWAALPHETARLAVEIWRDAVRRTPEHLRPPVACLLAWTAWHSGDGALAWCALEECTDLDPEYSLAELIGGLLLNAVPPSSALDWAEGFDWLEALRAG